MWKVRWSHWKRHVKYHHMWSVLNPHGFTCAICENFTCKNIMIFHMWYRVCFCKGGWPFCCFIKSQNVSSNVYMKLLLSKYYLRWYLQSFVIFLQWELHHSYRSLISDLDSFAYIPVHNGYNKYSRAHRELIVKWLNIETRNSLFDPDNLPVVTLS
jgi:hypothetical protein